LVKELFVYTNSTFLKGPYPDKHLDSERENISIRAAENIIEYTQKALEHENSNDESRHWKRSTYSAGRNRGLPSAPAVLRLKSRVNQIKEPDEVPVVVKVNYI
jgi:hypothetical protein